MAPSTPLTPSTPTPRRSYSLPASKTASSPDSQIEVLYNLPSARIIAFTTGTTTSRSSSNIGSPIVEEKPGSLSWSSRSERTIAIGPLRIYRAPGSVAFLNCSAALKPILPKSQCWEVDGSGKFVLQIRRPQYWRIEVPNLNKIEKKQYEDFKDVLAKVLLFEKTPCPFQRNFTVELPEAPQTPVKKRPWKPVERPKIDTTPLEQTNEKEEEKINTAIQAYPSDISLSTPEQIPISTTSFPHHSNHKPSHDVVDNAISSIYSNKEFYVDEEALDNVQPRLYSEMSGETAELREEQPQKEDRPLDKAKSEIPPLLSSPASEDCAPRTETPNETIDEAITTKTAPERRLAPSLLDNKLDDAIFGMYHGLEDEDDFSDATDDTNITPRSLLQPAFQSMTLEPEKESRPQALQNCSRSITAPPVLSLVTSPPSKNRRMSPLRTSTTAESDSDFSSSVDSFHSVQSWHSPLAPPSPPASASSSPTSTYPYPHENIVLPKRPNHTRDVSELTVTPETPQVWEMSPIPDMITHSGSMSPPPKTPTLVNDGSEKSDEEQSEIVTPPTVRSNIRHRATTSSNSRRRTLSPLPAAVNLFSPPRRRNRRLQTARHLPTAIIQKTCEILLSPPSHLLQLMLNIASKIAAGEWRGVLSGHGESVHWDFEEEYAGEGWFEDDYGISLAKTSTNSSKRSSTVTGGSWEVD